MTYSFTFEMRQTQQR